MNQFPAININNVRLMALWVLLLILILTFWHFALRQL